mmetsp:Transcript_40562/g.97204  ORF Transcript_40562/g.97204 Transcript_40562/m.97204 type:complete len:231 (+) Transcript_40562:1505-2197(+)
MPPTPTPEHPCTRHSPLGTLYSANGPSPHEACEAAQGGARREATQRAELRDERAKREGVEASLRQLESHQQQALRQQQVTHVAQMHALQSRLQGEVGEMRQACAVLRGGRDAAEAAGLMAAREALQTKQAALELSLRGLLAAASGDNGDGGSDSTPGGDGGSPGGGMPGGSGTAWREELEELEEQLATLRLQLHIADDKLQQRRQNQDSQPDEHFVACSTAPYVELIVHS